MLCVQTRTRSNKFKFLERNDKFHVEWYCCVIFYWNDSLIQPCDEGDIWLPGKRVWQVKQRTNRWASATWQNQLPAVGRYLYERLLTFFPPIPTEKMIEWLFTKFAHSRTSINTRQFETVEKSIQFVRLLPQERPSVLENCYLQGLSRSCLHIVYGNDTRSQLICPWDL